MQTIISLVAGGFGVSLVPASVGQVERTGVAFVPLAGPTPTIELALAWRRGSESPVRNEFLGVVPRAGARRALRRPASGGRVDARSALNVQGPRGYEVRSRGPCAGRRGGHRVRPVPWYVQYPFFLAVIRCSYH